MESRAAALLELAVAATRARLIATDGRRRGRRSRGRSEVLPSPRFPAVLVFEFSLLFPELPAFGGFLLFEHFGVPEGFPLSELLRGQRLTGRPASDFILLLNKFR
jgi:hypothetical protein